MSTGKTIGRGLPYPLETDTPDVAADMQTLAYALDDTGIEDFLKPGVVNSGDFKVTGTGPYTIAAGTAWLNNGSIGILGRQGLTNSVSAPAAPTAPVLTSGQCRSDQLYMLSNGVWGGTPTFAWVVGTVLNTSPPYLPGYLNSSRGAPPAGAVVIAELIYSFPSGGSQGSALYDRRPWAKGGAVMMYNSASPINCNVAGTVYAQCRLECSGRLVQAAVLGNDTQFYNNTGATKQPYMALLVNGNTVAISESVQPGNNVATGTTVPMRAMHAIFSPGPPGSYLFQWVTAWAGDNTGTNQWQWSSPSGFPVGAPYMEIAELNPTSGGNGIA